MSGWWERNPVDLMVATPISGPEELYYEWADNRTNVVLNVPQGLKMIWVKFPEPCIDVVRDKAVNIAIQNGARWLLFIDADVIPPPDVIPRLLKHDKEVVAGLYVRRHNPPFNEMLRLRTDGIPGLLPIRDGDYKEVELVECDAVGTGCVLIRTDVFEKVRPFQLTIDGVPARPAWFLWTEWRINPGMSEDFSFFVRCRQHGVKVFCDTSIKCKHVGPIKFMPSGNNSLALEFMGG